MDLVRRRRERDDVRCVVGGAQAQSVSLVAASGVVVVGAENLCHLAGCSADGRMLGLAPCSTSETRPSGLIWQFTPQPRTR
jgi:hypothetical protein